MRNLKTGTLCLALLLCFYIGAAQTTPDAPLTEPDYNKPKLFADLPERITVRVSDLDGLLNRSVGESVSLSLGSNALSLQGIIVSAASKYNGSINSVVLKSNNREGARLCISRSVNESGEVSYSGRILNTNYGDCYQLKNENGQYYLQKKKLYELLGD